MFGSGRPSVQASADPLSVMTFIRSCVTIRVVQFWERQTSFKTATTATGSVALKMAPNKRHSTQVHLYGNVYFTKTAVRLALNKMPGPAYSGTVHGKYIYRREGPELPSPLKILPALIPHLR